MRVALLTGRVQDEVLTRMELDGESRIRHDLWTYLRPEEMTIPNVLRPRIDRLKTKIDVLCADPALEHRLRRALSWLERGNAERDADAKYIFLWIAFNAAYAVDRKSELEEDVTEARRRESYFRTLVQLDVSRRIYTVLARELHPLVQDIMKNYYVYHGFWRSLTDGRRFDWRDWPNWEKFKQDQDFVAKRLGYGASKGSLEMQLRANAVVPVNDVAEVLSKLFDRLNVLRNQLMHGCATQNGHLNRRQVDAGAMVLGPLVCEFLAVMADNPAKAREWGPLAYPVRDDIREDRHEANR